MPWPLMGNDWGDMDFDGLGFEVLPGTPADAKKANRRVIGTSGGTLLRSRKVSDICLLNFGTDSQ